MLASLRYWQREGLMSSGHEIAEIATDGGTLEPLTAKAIDGLCERLNFGEDANGADSEATPRAPVIDIVIELDGGLVQSVFCTEENARVTVIDFESDGADEDDLTRVPIEDGKTKMADVREPACEPIPAHLAPFIANLKA